MYLSGAKCTKFKTCQLWNDLPEKLKLISSFKELKTTENTFGRWYVLILLRTAVVPYKYMYICFTSLCLCFFFIFAFGIFSFLMAASLMCISPFCAACHIECIVDLSHCTWYVIVANKVLSLSLSLSLCPHASNFTECFTLSTNVSAIRRWLQLRFDGRSTAYQRSLSALWRNPLAAVTLTYLFLGRSAALHAHSKCCRSRGRIAVVEHTRKTSSIFHIAGENKKLAHWSTCYTGLHYSTFIIAGRRYS